MPTFSSVSDNFFAVSIIMKTIVASCFWQIDCCSGCFLLLCYPKINVVPLPWCSGWSASEFQMAAAGDDRLNRWGPACR